MKKKSVILLIILGVVTIIQMLIFEKNNLFSSVNDKQPIVIKQNVAIPFKDVYNNISQIDNLKIKNISKQNKKWHIDVYLSGNKDKIKDVLSNLNNYIIKNYKITGEKDDLLLELELIK